VRLVVGISGASGAIYGIRALEALRTAGVETHLVLTGAARETIEIETDRALADVEALATRIYRIDDTSAGIASGSFRADGMVVIPCSMKTLGGLASGYAENLLLRAGAVTLKERRPLVLVARETPLTLIDLENMSRLARAGATILPAMPAFHNRPKTVDDLVNHVVGKVLDVMGVPNDLVPRWNGPAASRD
jgi:4-hydroxy-3-polyprenylbenzoate decarboxylase